MPDTKPNFNRAVKAATNLLIDQEFDSLMIDARLFTFDRHIIIETFQKYGAATNTEVSDLILDGHRESYVARFPNGINLILYDDSLPNERKQWSIAHEIGHVYLDHMKDDPKEEIEAHFFAAQLLMPEIVLRYARKINNSLTANDIYCHFNVSFESAVKRVATLNKTKQFITYSGNDKILHEKFKGIVENTFQRQKMTQLAF